MQNTRLLIFLNLATFSSIHALQCFECGILSIAPGNEAVSSSCEYPSIQRRTDSCAIDLSNIMGHSSSPLLGLWSSGKKSNVTDTPTLSEVCYILKGSFRNEEILMRGCDTMPFSSGGDDGQQTTPGEQVSTTLDFQTTMTDYDNDITEITTEEDNQDSSLSTKPSSMTTEKVPQKCLTSEELFKVWFETESGREYIELSSLCICNSDFCNSDDSPLDGVGIVRSYHSLLLVVGVAHFLISFLN